ncbi:SpoIIE family protein phosphatase [Streptomyces sp. PA03-1a]|nr:SpoIIE family protein phosphatase [Streptomyces sp. PA03-1a]MDX2816789.1 SpoIIE family protein phosphatase [Streptomyces sp. PA03-5A]
MVESVRVPILASWERCQTAGLDPERLEVPYTDDVDPTGALVRAAGPVLDRLAGTLSGTRTAVLLTDDRGLVIDRRAAEPPLLPALDRVRLAPGFSYHELDAGTNGIGTALAARHPVRVSGEEHFSAALRGFTCFGVPVRHPLSGRVEGVLDLTSLYGDAHPLMAELARGCALAIEQRLLEECGERERALLQGYLTAEHRGAAAAPLRLDGVGHIPGVGPPAGLTDGDESVLAETAAGLIAAGRREALELPLSHGRTAHLLCRPLAGGAVVEVSVPGDAGARGNAPGGAASRPLLVGEPGVGRLAVAARRRLELLSDAALRIGTTLDVARTAREIVEAAVPRFADHATVDLYCPVLDGTAPGAPGAPGAELRRVATDGAARGHGPYARGEPIRLAPDSPQARALYGGSAVRDTTPGPDGEPSAVLAVPLRARDTLLGVATFQRAARTEPFAEDDLTLARDLAARAAVCIDNARLFTREHHLALELQRSLLPHGVPEQHAVDVAHRYLPAARGRVGGDWFDVIPLSGARVALVVGDVVGHGIHAAAAMGRLRTAVHNFSALDLPPDELLGRLDDLVVRLDDESGAGPGLAGATCLYAVYDPVARRCQLARAGHPPPALLAPDGEVRFPDLPAGPPLGLGGLPFESAEFAVPEGSGLVLYTDGLIEGRHLDPDTGMRRLGRALTAVPRGCPPEEVCAALEAALRPAPSADDVVLLVARTRSLDERQVACWDVPDDPAAVSALRSAITRRLRAWGLDELSFTTELIASELITNAIRHGAGPVQARLLRDRALVFEVADASGTSPRLRRAATTDEGGRGIFLVAQLCRRWGTRYTERGKVIWTEQQLPA